MKDRIIGLLMELDRLLAEFGATEVLDLYHLGRSAVVWQFGSQVTTRDFDVIRPHVSDELIAFVEKSVGKGTDAATRHGTYLEFVNEGWPPVSQGCERRSTLEPGAWTRLRLFELDPHDLAATKLRRFAAHDREDIRFLCDLGKLESDRLREILELAYLLNLEKDGDRFRDDAFEHLEIVQKYLRGEIREF